MIMFPTPKEATKPRLETGKTIGLTYAVILVVLAVAQLFTFDEFVDGLGASGTGVPVLLLALFAPLIVAFEVFALPFLLRMTVSDAFRWFSMFCGWLAAGTWLAVSFVGVLAGGTTSAWFLGTVGHLATGWWTVGVSMLFCILAAWASIGLWPAPVKRVNH